MKSDIEFLLEEKYKGVSTQDFFNDCELLAQGVPLAYVIGFVPFLGCTIYLDSHPLIPRPETEYWTEIALRLINETFPATPIKCLDLFAGSGAVGVAVLYHIARATVDFAEIEPTHKKTIEKNIEKNSVRHRGTFIESDVFVGIKEMYHVILANPPYLSRSRLERLEKSVLMHEPERALFAPDDGFMYIRETIDGLPEHLSKKGFAIIEHEPEHCDSLSAHASVRGFTADTRFDQFGVPRFSILRHMA